jgi:integrase
LKAAAEAAEKWYLDIRYKLSRGEVVDVRYTVARAFRDFMKWQRSLIVTGESNEKKCQRYEDTWSVVKGFFSDLSVQAITAITLEEFRTWRLEKAKKPLSAKTLHNDYILIRQILKRAEAHGHLKGIPTFPTLQLKHTSPDWFDLNEYRKLIRTSRKRCEDVREKNPHHYSERRELHAFILLMSHSCIRVDECLNLRWSNCVEPKENKKLPFKKRTVLIEIKQGKVGARSALGMFGAVQALALLRELNPEHQPSDRLFSTSHRQAFAKLLDAAALRRDSKGRLRNQKTLRHTSIMMRCLFERDLTTAELARLSGTSMVVLENYYLSHLKARHIQQGYVEDDLRTLDQDAKASL